MIRSFRDDLTEDIFNGVSNKKTRKIPVAVTVVAVRKMDQLNASIELSDLRIPPGNRLEKLKGKLINYYSIRINDQFRLIFEWKNSDAFNVSIVDYH